MKRYGNLIYWLLTIILMAIPIMADFVRMGFSSDFFSDPGYWLGVLSVQIPIVVIMFVSRSHGEMKERQTNKEYNEYRETVQRGYARINTDGKSKAFEDYVAADSRRRRLTAYTTRIRAKIAAVAGRITRTENAAKRREMRLRDIARRRRSEEKERNPIYMFVAFIRENRLRKLQQKREYYEARLAAAEEEIDYLRVRHIPITVSMIFGDAEKVRAREDDIRTHKGRSIATLVMTKALGIVAFGVLATSSVVFDFSGDTISIIYKAVIKLAQMVISVYFGLLGGRQYVRDDLINSYRKKVTYIQQFLDKTSA